jgi:ABC-2 type transport system ATP-binding protein
MGMRQRLGLASALIGDLEILVLDEPLNGLDPQGIRWLRTLLRERVGNGKTVLLSSHVLTEAAQTVDDVVVIHKGRLVRQGSIGELERLGTGGVLVSTPTPDRFMTAVRRAGAPAEYHNGGGRLLITEMDAARRATACADGRAGPALDDAASAHAQGGRSDIARSGSASSPTRPAAATPHR